MLAEVFTAFVEQSPVSVMMRALMERIFRPERLDELFETHAQVQYTRELLFSTLVNLLSLVVCGIQPSVNAAYKAKAKEINVNRSAVYQKLNGVETQVSAALLRETAAELGQLIQQMGGSSPPLLAGYQAQLLDGNALAATEHRLKVLQTVTSAPLPGKSLVVLDPASRLAVDIFPCQDGYTQERRLLRQVIDTVQSGQLWIADRNMCTLGWLMGVAERQAAFIVREHQNLPWQALGELKPMGQLEAGEVGEQLIQIQSGEATLTLRRIVLRLARPTRHEEDEIVCLTNLPPAHAAATLVMQLYRERWQVEGLFLSVTQNFNGEIKTLAYPQAALFSFTLALITYNILATLKAALASVHGVGKIEAALSDFYVVNELQGTYRGMMIAIPPHLWQGFADMPVTELVSFLQNLAAKVHLKRFLKAPRQKKKKKKQPPKYDPKHPHVSTARLLSGG